MRDTHRERMRQFQSNAFISLSLSDSHSHFVCGKKGRTRPAVIFDSAAVKKKEALAPSSSGVTQSERSSIWLNPSFLLLLLYAHLTVNVPCRNEEGEEYYDDRARRQEREGEIG